MSSNEKNPNPNQKSNSKKRINNSINAERINNNKIIKSREEFKKSINQIKSYDNCVQIMEDYTYDKIKNLLTDTKIKEILLGNPFMKEYLSTIKNSNIKKLLENNNSS